MPLPVIASSILAKAGTALATRGPTGIVGTITRKTVGGALGKASQMGKTNQMGGSTSSWMDSNPNESHWGS